MTARHALLLASVLWATAAAGEPGPLLRSAAGPHEVQIAEGLVLDDAQTGREVSLRVIYPLGDPPEEQGFPLVVFSTGAFCFPQLYDRVTTHWASHGYVVVAPDHLDSPNRDQPAPPEQYKNFLPSRVRDVTLIHDSIRAVAREAGLPVEIDTGRAAVSGHSFGAIISMIKIGLGVAIDYDDSWGEFDDDRFDVAVLLSAPGPGMKELTDDAYTRIRKPMFSTGGTNDIGRVDPGGLSAEEWRMQAYQLAPSGDKYSLTTAGSDHYLGGLICNAERGGEPDHDALESVRALTTVFLDAYVRKDPVAKEYLRTVDVRVLTKQRAWLRAR